MKWEGEVQKNLTHKDACSKPAAMGKGGGEVVTGYLW
jgi:hypothetical protein